MKPAQLRHHVSVYLFALFITLILCGFAAGILWIDMSANQTITSAGGLLWPLEERLLTWAEQAFVS